MDPGSALGHCGCEHADEGGRLQVAVKREEGGVQVAAAHRLGDQLRGQVAGRAAVRGCGHGLAQLVRFALVGQPQSPGAADRIGYVVLRRQRDQLIHRLLGAPVEADRRLSADPGRELQKPSERRVTAKPPLRPLAEPATSRASRSVTVSPCSSSRSAQPTPVIPAPITHTSATLRPSNGPNPCDGYCSCQRDSTLIGAGAYRPCPGENVTRRARNTIWHRNTHQVAELVAILAAVTTEADLAFAAAFLNDRFGAQAGPPAELVGCEWSRAYGYDCGGMRWVIRFSRYEHDLAKDRLAGRYGCEALPIPVVAEMGQAPDDLWYAITPYVEGSFLEDLDARHSGGRYRPCST